MAASGPPEKPEDYSIMIAVYAYPTRATGDICKKNEF
jgi:hypothetical protein